MSGIAEVMHNLGFKVSGSDSTSTNVTAELKRMGIRVYTKHAAKNITGVDVIVSSTAITKNNIEIISTGGTSKVISEMGIDVVNVSSLTKFPEIMDGRIKTLHPQIHGGILAKRISFPVEDNSLSINKKFKII